MAAAQASGDLGTVTVREGQSGVPASGEGTAMLEIVHDLAPGAELFYATGFGGPASFAQNIRDLRFQNGCDIIIDDVTYANESGFQDGVIAQALADCAAHGITGKDITPYLLGRIVEITGGDSLRTNIALVRNNARLGAQLAVAYAARQHL